MSRELTTEEREHLEYAIEDAGLEPSEILYLGYSGRGMYGDQCFGLDVDYQRDVTRVLLYLASQGPDEMELALQLSDALTWDSLGLGSIGYFPGFNIPTDEEAGDE